MNRLIPLGLAMLAGAAIGATAVNGLRAQNKAPGVYFVADVSEISDPAAFGPAVQKTGPIITASGGHVIARTENIVPLHGTPPKRFVIVGFDSMDAAKAWTNDPAMKELQPIIDKYSTQRRFLVEGLM